MHIVELRGGVHHGEELVDKRSSLQSGFLCSVRASMPQAVGTAA